MKRKSLVFGGSGIAGLYNALDPEEAYCTVYRALQMGIRHFDTAPHYGCGLAEERLGTALRRAASDLSVDLNEVHVFSKVGRVIVDREAVACEEYEIEYSNMPGSTESVFPGAPIDRVPILDYSYEGVLRSHTDTVSRLAIDQRLYGLRVHDCDCDRHISDVANPVTGGLRALFKLRTEGHVREVSLGSNSVSATCKILKIIESESCFAGADVDSILLANSWNLLDHSRDTLELFKECKQRGIRITLAGIFASGILASVAIESEVPGKKLYYMYGEADISVVQRVERWKELCREFNISLAEAALRFAMLHDAVDSICVGFRTSQEVEQVVSFFNTLNSVESISGDGMNFWRTAIRNGLVEDYAIFGNAAGDS